VRVGVMDGLPGLEKAFREDFPKAITARCWFHSLQNAAAKTPKRLHDAFLILAKKVMYADCEVAASAAFGELEVAMNGDCQRAVDCLRKDLHSLVSHFKFPKKIWKALTTTYAVERSYKEFKRRSRPMEGDGDDTLTTLLAFTAMRLEMTWRRRSSDSYADMPPERIGMQFLDGKESAIAHPELH
jgi:putative transposase